MGEIYARRVGNDYETLEDHIERCLTVSKMEDYEYIRNKIEKAIKNICIKNGYSEEFEGVLVKWMLNDVIEYHDSGKNTKAFQNKITTEGGERVNHSTVSAVMWMNGLDLTEYKKVGKDDRESYIHYCKWVYLTSCLINMHHTREVEPNRVYGFEKTLYNLFEDKNIKEEEIELEMMRKILLGWVYLGEDSLTVDDLYLITNVHHYLREVDHRASLRYELSVKVRTISENQLKEIRRIIDKLTTVYEIDDVMRSNIMIKYIDTIYKNEVEKDDL